MKKLMLSLCLAVVPLSNASAQYSCLSHASTEELKQELAYRREIPDQRLQITCRNGDITFAILGSKQESYESGLSPSFSCAKFISDISTVNNRPLRWPVTIAYCAINYVGKGLAKLEQLEVDPESTLTKLYPFLSEDMSEAACNQAAALSNSQLIKRGRK